jgi:hypothetical protein
VITWRTGAGGSEGHPLGHLNNRFVPSENFGIPERRPHCIIEADHKQIQIPRGTRDGGDLIREAGFNYHVG